MVRLSEPYSSPKCLSLFDFHKSTASLFPDPFPGFRVATPRRALQRRGAGKHLVPVDSPTHTGGPANKKAPGRPRLEAHVRLGAADLRRSSNCWTSLRRPGGGVLATCAAISASIS